ncbi:MAG: archease [Acidobacteria bacterium]|nr:archease [Acidobacteriota bacterium]
MKPYEQVEHTADLALRVTGAGPAELLDHAVRGLCSLITDPRAWREEDARDVDVQGGGLEDLLVEVLNEMLFLLDARQFLALRLEVLQLDHDRLRGRFHGQAFAPDPARIRHVVKAATYHGLAVRHGDEGWSTVIVFDT